MAILDAINLHDLEESVTLPVQRLAVVAADDAAPLGVILGDAVGTVLVVALKEHLARLPRLAA